MCSRRAALAWATLSASRRSVTSDMKPFHTMLPSGSRSGTEVPLTQRIVPSGSRRRTSRAHRVIVRDRNVDAYYTQIFRELLTYMMEDPRNIFRASRLQSIAKYLERIGDHVTNLGEMVVFMVKGKDIRHGGRQPGET